MVRHLAGAVLTVCFAWADVAWSAEAGEVIEHVIREAATATSRFAETRDKQTVLRHYAKDYLGVQDGESESRDAIEQWLSDYELELKKGNTLRFISAVSNVQPILADSIAWVTYDYTFQAVRNGDLVGQDVGKCTTLLRREPSAWLIFHEHCSKIRPTQ